MVPCRRVPSAPSGAPAPSRDLAPMGRWVGSGMAGGTLTWPWVSLSVRSGAAQRKRQGEFYLRPLPGPWSNRASQRNGEYINAALRFSLL